MTGIEWDGDSPADVAAAFERLPDVLANEFESAAQDIGLRFGAAAAEGAPSDRGRLRADLVEPLVEQVGKTIIRIRVGSNTDQARPMEEGTDPGHFPPPSELRGWARRVLGDESAAYPVARSISEAGLEAREFLQDAFEDASNIEYALDRINEAVTNAFAEVGLA